MQAINTSWFPPRCPQGESTLTVFSDTQYMKSSAVSWLFTDDSAQKSHLVVPGSQQLGHGALHGAKVVLVAGVVRGLVIPVVDGKA